MVRSSALFTLKVFVRDARFNSSRETLRTVQVFFLGGTFIPSLGK